LALAAPGKHVRTFVDEGAPLEPLLLAARDAHPAYLDRLRAALAAEQPAQGGEALNEPLSERELAVLRLVAEGLSNAAISRRLFLALSTVKGHNQRIFEKLHVQRRTEAVARARELGLL
jgi:LuxR family maltose regulon positive regulatory protein